jgi:hypothetical protein
VLTLFLPRDVAEYLAARAIREGKNAPGVIGDIHPDRREPRGAPVSRRSGLSRFRLTPTLV